MCIRDRIKPPQPPSSSLSASISRPEKREELPEVKRPYPPPPSSSSAIPPPSASGRYDHMKSVYKGPHPIFRDDSNDRERISGGYHGKSSLEGTSSSSRIHHESSSYAHIKADRRHFQYSASARIEA